VKVVVAGSRGFGDWPLLCRELDRRRERITELVSGTARGADLLGERWAAERGVFVRRFPADWRLHGQRAGFVRNREMAVYCDAAVLFWDGQSRGTAMMLALLRGLRRPVGLVRYR
jgi:hypothetical protein